MNNPRDEIREYLDKLIHRLLNINSLNQELRSILEWRTPQRLEALNLGAYFFSLASYSMSRTILVELSMLLSEREDRSLIDWLRKARTYANRVEPTRHDRDSGGRQPVVPIEYQSIIDDHLSLVQSKGDVLRRIRGRRNKVIAHMDEEYFEDPSRVYSDFPLTDNDIDDVLTVVKDILHTHYSLLFGADAKLEVSSVHTVDRVLRYARAWMRARRDTQAMLDGFLPRRYTEEDYDPDRNAT